jgi:uncharacterized protein YyaL (SSP411 family)
MSKSARRANRLSDSNSPYLLLHQHNPVDWYPWGEEALARARREDKPIFLSVGYSTCYWCHVMERESFSNGSTAELMNRGFVNIKLDREERPDLDELYMLATQVLTGHGGWPNSVFLTPELKPFFAGTYFPPEDRPGLPGFPRVLESMMEAWRSRRGDVNKQADEVAEALGRHFEERPEPSPRAPTSEVAERSLAALKSSFDPSWGGFGGPPKFPTPSNLLLLLEFSDSDREAAGMLETTLDNLVRGGIYDHIGGGFHRYATDREWKIPHFEKMLYDNGLLLELLACQWESTADQQAARAVRQTAGFLAREMTSEEGGLYSALDAETEGREGAFYVWTRQDLLETLGEENFGFLAPLLGFDRPPFFEGTHYVLHLPFRLEEQAERRRMSVEDLLAEIEPLRWRLLETRERRRRPLTDDKILTDWNGMAIAGLATAGRLLRDRSMMQQAEQAAEFLLTRLRPAPGQLLHAFRNGAAHTPAFLSDYVFVVRGLLSLYRATGTQRWLETAQELTEEQLLRLGDPRGGFFNAAESDDLLVRAKDAFDGAVPAANAVAVLNLIELERLAGGGSWGERAAVSLRAFAPLVNRVPEAARTLSLAARRFHAVSSEESLPPGVLEVTAIEAEDPVIVRAEWGAADAEGWRDLKVTVEIEPDWHIYAGYPEGEAPEWVEPLVLAATDLEMGNVVFPVPDELPLSPGPESVLVYHDSIVIGGRCRKIGDSPAVSLRFQACDDNRCIVPKTRAVELD